MLVWQTRNLPKQIDYLDNYVLFCRVCWCMAVLRTDWNFKLVYNFFVCIWSSWQKKKQKKNEEFKRRKNMEGETQVSYKQDGGQHAALLRPDRWANRLERAELSLMIYALNYLSWAVGTLDKYNFTCSRWRKTDSLCCNGASLPSSGGKKHRLREAAARWRHCRKAGARCRIAWRQLVGLNMRHGVLIDLQWHSEQVKK